MLNVAANQNMFNAVQVTVNRSGGENGKVPSFFGSVFGVNGTATSGTATVVSQILYGISPSEMAMCPNSQLTFDSNGHLYLGANPGISAGFKSALAAIVGQTRLIPIFDAVSGNGNNAQYEIVAFVGVEICDVNLTGSMSSKHLTVQPATVHTLGGIPSTSSTTRTSYGIYSPVFLVK